MFNIQIFKLFFLFSIFIFFLYIQIEFVISPIWREKTWRESPTFDLLKTDIFFIFSKKILFLAAYAQFIDYED